MILKTKQNQKQMSKCICCGKTNTDYPTPGYIPNYKDLIQIIGIAIVFAFIIFYILKNI